MANQVDLEFAARTDTGRVRPHNEDAIAMSEAYGVAIVADGMGGYNAGEVASRIAASVLKESLEEQLREQQIMRSVRSRKIQKIMVDSIVHANDSILEAARLEPRYSGMGTTLVAALFHHDRVTIAHVGDSRAYRFRDGRLLQITRDHSLLQEQIDAGLISAEEAVFAVNKNLVTRAMGVDRDVEVEVHDHSFEAGDVFVLCSDGLSDMMADDDIAAILSKRDLNLESACNRLVDKANDNGGRDNVSVVLVRVRSGNTESRGMLDRIFAWTKSGA